MKRSGSPNRDIDEFKDAVNNTENDLYEDMLTIMILTFSSTYILGAAILSILDYYFYTVSKRWAYIAKGGRQPSTATPSYSYNYTVPPDPSASQFDPIRRTQSAFTP